MNIIPLKMSLSETILKIIFFFFSTIFIHLNSTTYNYFIFSKFGKKLHSLGLQIYPYRNCPARHY